MKKKLSYIAFAIMGLLMASCMGDDYAGARYDENPYGNNTLTEDNVVSIATLKDMYKKGVTTSVSNGTPYELVDKDVKIKGIVTSSDEQGNVYSEFALQDSTDAILVSLAQGGIYGFLPVGTEVLLDLKGLYVGNYGLQPEIGVPAVDSRDRNSLGRISRATFDQHYKILSTGNTVEPEVFNINTWDLDKDAGKLAVIRNVSFNHKVTVDTTYAHAGDGAGSVSWYFNELDRNKVQVYNSNYADFANAVVPTGPVNVTGIMKRYNNYWELIIRTLDDVQAITDPLEGIDGTGKGTLEEPYDVTRALSLISNGRNDANTDVYIKGIVSSINDIDTGQYGNATYFISLDGTEKNQLEVYHGYYINGEKFTEETAKELTVGKEVVVLGKLVLYGETPEVTSRSQIISIK